MKLNNLRRWSRLIHRDLSYLFSGMVLIYAISGVYMNHRDKINPNYSIDRIEFALDYPINSSSTVEQLMPLLESINEDKNYTKHYSPKENAVKVFLKGGSNLYIDTQSQEVVYEKLSRRVVVSAMTKLHYNPGSWWTIFSDIFAISLILIVLSGIIIVRGNRGLWGRGGIELLIGIIIPILFLLL